MRALSRWALLASVATVSLAACRESVSVESPTGPSLKRTLPGASFDWTMPARFGADGDGDGLVDYFQTPDAITPPTWTVNFDACQLPVAQRYVWYVNHRRVAAVTACRYTHDFPSEGTYDVSLHLMGTHGDGMWIKQTVTVQDWLIVSFGDSYASGEGVPEVPAANEATLASITAALQSLVDARRQLQVALDKLQEAVERKGLAQAALADAEQTLAAFLVACTPNDFQAIKQCADFLLGLPFDTFKTAYDHFATAVTNAQERLTSAIQAFDAAQAAAQAAGTAVTNLEATIAQLKGGLEPARWQPHGQRWGADDCHRSAHAAPARAALALENADPRTSVTFVHVACSGARVDKFPGRMQQQVPWADTLIGGREIDAVLLSVGGNDAGFASIAAACAVQQPCYAAMPALDPAQLAALCDLLGTAGFAGCNSLFDAVPQQSAKTIVETGVDSLPLRYDKVDDLFAHLRGLSGPVTAGRGKGRGRAAEAGPERVRSERVYISQYVDMTKDDAQAYCQFDPTDVLGSMPGISLDEMQWLDTTAAASINGAVAAAAAAHGWNLVGDIYRAYAPHGYCAEQHWVTRIAESPIYQGDFKGLAHPNNLGQIRSGQSIFAALLQDLYPQGLEGRPRAPDPATSFDSPGLMVERGRHGRHGRKH